MIWLTYDKNNAPPSRDQSRIQRVPMLMPRSEQCSSHPCSHPNASAHKRPFHLRAPSMPSTPCASYRASHSHTVHSTPVPSSHTLASHTRSQQLSERVYAMDVNYPLAIVATADRNLHIYNLTQPQVWRAHLAAEQGRVCIPHSRATGGVEDTLFLAGHVRWLSDLHCKLCAPGSHSCRKCGCHIL